MLKWAEIMYMTEKEIWLRLRRMVTFLHRECYVGKVASHRKDSFVEEEERYGDVSAYLCSCSYGDLADLVNYWEKFMGKP